MDITHYRRSEALARQVMPSWRHAQIHRPQTFVAAGFPIQVDSSADLLQLLDTMHEARFSGFMAELGGFAETDIVAFVDALADYAAFYREHFHGWRCTLPLATMLAHYVLYRKLIAWPRHARWLEIGPGCGYLSFFVARDPHVTRYDQIETTESFYLLQHLVNRHCFGAAAVEHAALDPDALRPAVMPHPLQPDEPRVAVALPAAGRCHHWPWWRIADLAGARFDVVTSNANLTEMSEEAVRHYVALIGRTLEPDGAVVIQDLGGGTLSPSSIFRHFESAGLTPVMVANPGAVPGRAFALATVVLVRPGRSLHRFDGPDGGPADPHRVATLMPAVDAPRRPLGAEEIGRLVQARLATQKRG